MGRLYQIIGRNTPTTITFTYTWANGNASSAQNIATINATHSDGHALALTFAQFGSYTELASITRPDGKQITYSYDTTGNLLIRHVARGTPPTMRRGRRQSRVLPRSTGTTPGRTKCSALEARVSWPSSWSDGSNYGFTYDANTTSGHLTWINDYGLVNFTPNDGTGAQLQSGPSMTEIRIWRQMEFLLHPETMEHGPW